MLRAIKKELISVAVLFGVLILISFIPVKGVIRMLLHLIPYFLAGYKIFIKAFENIRKKKFFNRRTVLTFATAIAVIIGAYFEATVVLLLFRLGKVLENYVRREMVSQVRINHNGIFERAVKLFSAYITPVVLGVAFLIFLIGTIAQPSQWKEFLYRALVLSALSSGFVLEFSLPVALSAGVIRAKELGARLGSVRVLERLARCTTVVFDRFGILSDGCYTVTAHPEAISEKQLMSLTAMALEGISHPIAAAIKENASSSSASLGEVRRLEGLGVVALLGKKSLAVGNETLMKKLKITPPPCSHDGATVIHTALGGTYLGHIAVKDGDLEDSDGFLYRLKSCGVKSTVMLTDDSAVDRHPAIDEYYTASMPESKARVIGEIASESAEHEMVLYMGHTLFDSPADVDVLLGEGEDREDSVIIPDGSPQKLPQLIKLAQRTALTVKINVIGVAAAKLVLTVLATVGVLGLPFAVFADTLITALATVNAIVSNK